MPDNKPADESKHMFYDPTEHRIRSFVTRAGRLSTAQGKAIDTLGPQFCIPYSKTPLDFAQAFGRNAPTILEIGFGMGETTAKIAAGMPEKNFLGVEVHTPGVGSLLKLIGEQGLTNLRLIQHDAFEVITNMIAPASLAGAHVFFPDPWHKARQQAAVDSGAVRESAGVAYCAGRLSALRHRLAGICGADAGGVECGTCVAECR